MRRLALLSTIALWIWLATSCQAGGSGGRANDNTPTPGSTDTPSAKGREIAVPPGAEDQVARAKRDMAGRLRVPEQAVAVVGVEEVEWPDTSLGCPEPGKMYAQVITPGYRVLLESGGKVFEYHTDKGKNVVLCTKQP